MQNDDKSGKRLQTTSFTIAPNIIVFWKRVIGTFVNYKLATAKRRKHKTKFASR